MKVNCFSPIGQIYRRTVAFDLSVSDVCSGDVVDRSVKNDGRQNQAFCDQAVSPTYNDFLATRQQF